MRSGHDPRSCSECLMVIYISLLQLHNEQEVNLDIIIITV